MNMNRICLILRFYDKNNNLIPYSFVGPSYLFSLHNSVKKSTLRQSSILMGKLKGINSLSTSRFERTKQNKDLLNANNHQIIDNKLLKNYYNEIRQRISEEKKENKNKLLKSFPFPIKKSLINQENIFKKLNKEKKLKKNRKIKEKM